MRLPRIRFRVRWEHPEPEPTPELEPEPGPAIVRTHVEHDLSELNATPVMIEPSAYFRAIAVNNAGLYLAYREVGFDQDRAFELMTMHLDAALNRGRG